MTLVFERKKCTKENPKPKDAPGWWSHEDAECYGESSDGSVDYYRCRICGAEWKIYYDD